MPKDTLSAAKTFAEFIALAKQKNPEGIAAALPDESTQPEWLEMPIQVKKTKQGKGWLYEARGDPPDGFFSQVSDQLKVQFVLSIYVDK